MSDKIEVMGISVDKCYAEDVMENISEHWEADTLSTYGIVTMNLLMEAQKDAELREYIESLDKAVVYESEIIKASGQSDEHWEEEVSEQGFFSTLFWLLNEYKNKIFILGENEEDTEKFCDYLKEKYPGIRIIGNDSLLGEESDHVDRVINEINAMSPEAVLSCSRTYELEKFVKRNRKMMNTSVWFSLGSCLEIFKETGIKAGWLNRLMEKSSFKKMVSKYKERQGKCE